MKTTSRSSAGSTQNTVLAGPAPADLASRSEVAGADRVEHDRHAEALPDPGQRGLGVHRMAEGRQVSSSRRVVAEHEVNGERAEDAYDTAQYVSGDRVVSFRSGMEQQRQPGPGFAGLPE
jgi:hypothetical protein